MPILLPGETVASFLGRPGLYKRLRYRARLHLWRSGLSAAEPEWRLLPFLVDPGRAAVDVGANYGAYAGELARLSRRVHCFEPHPSVAESLRRRLPAHVQVHALALSDRSGETALVMPVAEHGRPAVAGASIEGANLKLAAWREVASLPCRTARLDDVIDEPVGFIKIDVVGHELAVLQGAERILKRDRPTLMVESVRSLHPQAPFHVVAHLQGFGYAAFLVFDGRILNFAAFRPDLHQPLRADGEPASPFARNFVFLPTA